MNKTMGIKRLPASACSAFRWRYVDKSGYPPTGEIVLGAFSNGSKRAHCTFFIDDDGYLLISLSDGKMISQSLTLIAWTRCPWPKDPDS